MGGTTHPVFSTIKAASPTSVTTDGVPQDIASATTLGNLTITAAQHEGPIHSVPRLYFQFDQKFYTIDKFNLSTSLRNDLLLSVFVPTKTHKKSIFFDLIIESA